MGHPGEELILGTVGMLCHGQGIPKRLSLGRQLPLHLPQLRHIRDINKDDQIYGLSFLPVDTGGIDLQSQRLSGPAYDVHGKVKRLPGQHLMSVFVDNLDIVLYVLPVQRTAAPAARLPKVIQKTSIG